jgi:hypothetical protein
MWDVVNDGKCRRVIICIKVQWYHGTFETVSTWHVEFIIMWRLTIRSRFSFVWNLNLPTMGVSKVAHIIVPQRYYDGLYSLSSHFFLNRRFIRSANPIIEEQCSRSIKFERRRTWIDLVALWAKIINPHPYLLHSWSPRFTTSSSKT